MAAQDDALWKAMRGDVHLRPPVETKAAQALIDVIPADRVEGGQSAHPRQLQHVVDLMFSPGSVSIPESVTSLLVVLCIGQ